MQLLGYCALSLLHAEKLCLFFTSVFQLSPTFVGGLLLMSEAPGLGGRSRCQTPPLLQLRERVQGRKKRE